jgi:hypothetical protein
MGKQHTSNNASFAPSRPIRSEPLYYTRIGRGWSNDIAYDCNKNRSIYVENILYLEIKNYSLLEV